MTKRRRQKASDFFGFNPDNVTNDIDNDSFYNAPSLIEEDDQFYDSDNDNRKKNSKKLSSSQVNEPIPNIILSKPLECENEIIENLDFISSHKSKVKLDTQHNKLLCGNTINESHLSPSDYDSHNIPSDNRIGFENKGDEKKQFSDDSYCGSNNSTNSDNSYISYAEKSVNSFELEEANDYYNCDEESDIPELIEEDEFIIKYDSRNLKDKTEEVPNKFCKTESTDFVNINQIKPQNKTVFNDKIGCFNIQNQFEHMAAGELFLKGNFSLLAFQEPYSVHTRAKESWEAYMKKELYSAKIETIFSKYQVILYDDTKWRGRIAEDFKIFQKGRVISLVVKINKEEFVGIISVYAITFNGSENSNKKNERKKLKTRIKTTEIIKNINRQWSNQFKNICTIIVGDLQETVSVDDRDNYGSYRRESPDKGILSATNKSHYSLVRNVNKHIPYWTRIGKAGSRGIDHILFPKDSKFASWVNAAQFERDLGEEFFPSDHILLSCELETSGIDGSLLSKYSMKNCYRRVSNIKIKCDEDDDGVCFDDSQFKTEMVKEQQKLFNEIQKITDPSSNKETKTLLNNLNSKIKSLFHDIWDQMNEQNMHGTDNALFECNDRIFTEMENLATDFNKSIKIIMEKLKLQVWNNEEESTKKCRDSLIKGKGFQLFDSLPITTKIRYLRSAVGRKQRTLKALRAKMKRSLNADNMKNESKIPPSQLLLFNKHTSDFDAIELQLDRISKLNLFDKNAEKINTLFIKEVDEWKKHIEAIEFSRDKNAAMKVVNDSQRTENFKFDDDKMLPKINNAMLHSDCKQIFLDEHDDCIDTSFLVKDIDRWRDEIRRCIENISHIREEGFDENIAEYTCWHVDNAIDFLEKLQNKIISSQTWYSNNKLVYYSKINKPGNLKRKLLPIKRDTPKTHTVIWDDNEGSYRNCKNVEEELTATKKFHGDWMDNSKAKQNCAFAKLIFKGKGGARGIKLDGKRKIKKKDIKKLVYNGKHMMSAEVRKAFLDAHNGIIKELFSEPDEDNELFNFPFFLINKNGLMDNEDSLSDNFNKALNSIPGKARFDGFHLAVIGRFNEEWRQTTFNLIKLILATRFMPHEFKKIARIPIPKPNAPNEYRPISLCHDLYCFINGIVAEITSRALEEAGIIPDGLAAYIKGRGCSMLVATELGIREDCIESNLPACRLDEDEEKFFDRICLELILTVLRINGFPIKGFLELKASCMWDKDVEIITNRGSVFSKFNCGLEQGNPDSPKTANLVIMLKHILWKTITAKLNNKYKMFSIDYVDGVIEISSTGFSDDNTQNNSNPCVNDLIKDLKKYIKLSGDLSMVLKIGRKGSKCVIYLYNLPAEKVLDLPVFETIAWSFKDDCPTKEIIPVKVYLQKEEVIKLQDLIKDPNLKDKAMKLLNKKDNKHLGLYMDLDANTEESCKKTLDGAKERIRNMKLYNLNVIPLRITANMLITTMHSFAPLQKNYSVDSLIECDKLLLNSIRSTCGFSRNDANHPIFLSERAGGHGIKSFLECDLKAVARELEVVLNGKECDGRVLRSRVAAIRNRISFILGTNNHIRDAILKMARYGLFLRDKQDGSITNRILDLIALKLNRMPVGDPGFVNDGGAILGVGDPYLTQTALGGTWHLSIKNFNEGIWNEDQMKYMVGPDGWELINECKMLAQEQEISDSNAMTDYFEWSISKNPYRKKDISDHNNWNLKYINCINEGNINRILDGKSWTFDIKWRLIKKDIQIDPLTCINWRKENPQSINDRGEVILQAWKSKSPILIATDGGHENWGNGKHATSAAMVLCILDIRENESIESKQWMNREVIPLLARSCILPCQLGTHKGDCNLGEAMASCLQEECLPAEICRCIIMDSEAVRSRFIEIRNNKRLRDRRKIRCIFPGIGKGIMSRLNFGIRRWKGEKSIKNLIPINAPIQYAKLCEELARRHNKFGEIMDEEFIAKEELRKVWKRSYLDKNNIKSIWKVDSHQLENDGKRIKMEKKRFPQLVPNLALLNSNHWADLCASLALKWTKEKIFNVENNKIVKYTDSEFRFFFTWKGNLVDKHTCQFLGDIFEAERLRRWQSKEAHGFLGRILPESNFVPKDLSFKAGLRRFLLYFTNTHTRSIYKCVDYCNAATMFIKTKLLTESEESIDKEYLETLELDRPLLLRCAWCESHWVDFNEHDNREFKGNRRHVTIFCKNKRISSFRNFIDDEIEEALVDLYKAIGDEVGILGNNLWLHKVQDTLLELQVGNIGRVKRKRGNNSKNVKVENYLSINGWLKFLKLISIEEGLVYGDKYILSHILGLRHSLGDGLLHERDCGIVDSIAIGVIPQKLEDCIIASFKDAVKNNWNLKAKESSFNILKAKWKSITKLIRIRVIGIHRICNTVASDFKKEWMSTFDLESQKKRRIRRDKEAKEEESDSDNDLEIDCKKDSSNSKLVTTNNDKPICKECIPEAREMKICKGIKCSLIHNVWISDTKGSKSKKIRSNMKTCQMCAKIVTALRKSIIIGHWLVKEDKNINENSSKRNLFLKNMCETSKLFVLGDILEKYIGDSITTSTINLKDRNGKITDCTRIILRCLGQILGFQTLPIFHDKFLATIIKNSNEQQETVWHIRKWGRLEKAINLWQDILQDKEFKLKDEKQKETKLRETGEIDTDNIENKVTYQNIFAPLESNNKKDLKRKPEEEAPSNPKQLKRKKRTFEWQVKGKFATAFNEIDTSGNLLSSDWVELVLDIIRRGGKENVFIATVYTTSFILRDRNNNEGWRMFGRLFKCRQARSKSNGIYIVPSFMGANDLGHWFVNMVIWRNNRGIGYTLDSLNSNDNEKEIIRNKIVGYFGQNYIQDWKSIHCLRQTEVECGPRMLLAILQIYERVGENNVEDTLDKIANLDDIQDSNKARAVRSIVGEYLKEGANIGNRANSEVTNLGSIDLTKE